MESSIILIDTDFAWEYLSGNLEAIEFMAPEKSEVYAISSITTAELIKGCGNKAKLSKLYKAITDFLVLHTDTEISIQAVELVKNYHLSHNIGINDAYIAATCLYYNIELATCNTSDYHYIPNLKLAKHNVKPKRKGWDFFL
ncbi:MAG: PilT protein domain protein [Segetibacter sp.]|nr:PilT protein domain protein [Segetibacter sp.]